MENRKYANLSSILLLGVICTQVSYAASITGHIDDVVERNGNTIISGWACATTYIDDSGIIDVHAYAGGAYGSGGTIVGYSQTGMVRNDPVVNAICGTSLSNQSFEIAISANNTNTHKNKLIYVHGISPSGWGLPNLTIGKSGHYKLHDSPLKKLKAAQNILWIGAHPDDEIIVSPVLAEACEAAGKTCTFLVMTEGATGPCLSSKCDGQNTGEVRVEEMINSAQFIAGNNANVEQYSFSGGADINTIEANWNAELPGGGTTKTLDFIVQRINAINPDIIISFDPRHGTTCNPAHRVIGDIVYRAVRSNNTFITPDDAYVVTSKFDMYSLPPAVGWDASSWEYDADGTINSALNDVSGWDFLVDDMNKHPSQWASTEIAAAEVAPVPKRKVSLQSMSDYVNSHHPNYDVVCAHEAPYNYTK